MTKKPPELVYPVKTGKIEIPTIDNIERPWFDTDLVENVHIVNLSMGDNHHSRNAAPEIEKCVDFYCPFPLSEFCLGEERWTQVDGGGVQSIHGMIQYYSKGILDIKLPCPSDENLCKICIDTPIPNLVDFLRVATMASATHDRPLKKLLCCRSAHNVIT
jgi:hypothetical protein